MGGGGHLERLHRVSPESTIVDVVSMVSRQDVTRLTDPNSLYALAVALAVKRDTTVRLRWTPQRRRLTDRPYFAGAPGAVGGAAK